MENQPSFYIQYVWWLDTNQNQKQFPSLCIGIGAVPAGQAMAWPLFGRQKENLLQIVRACVDNKFYNERTSLCRFQRYANSFNSYFSTVLTISSINMGPTLFSGLDSWSGLVDWIHVDVWTRRAIVNTNYNDDSSKHLSMTGLTQNFQWVS